MLLAWASERFLTFKKIDNVDKQEKYAAIMSTCMQTRVLNGLSLQIQKALAAKHEG